MIFTLHFETINKLSTLIYFIDWLISVKRHIDNIIHLTLVTLIYTHFIKILIQIATVLIKRKL